mgnify:CR=1 FL=1
MRIRAKVFGRVQGVFFRANAKEKAQELGLNGWVKNREDGSVEMVIEGKEKTINDLLDWCKSGPGISKVNNINILKEEEKEKLKGFEILY